MVITRVYVIFLLFACVGFSQERKNYLKKRESREIQQLEYRQYIRNRARRDIGAVVQLVPAGVAGFYFMNQSVEQSEWESYNDTCLPDSAHQAQQIATFCAGMVALLPAAHSVLSVFCNWCVCGYGSVYCYDCGAMCLEESCQLLNHFSCNAAFELIKLAQRKLAC